MLPVDLVGTEAAEALQHLNLHRLHYPKILLKENCTTTLISLRIIIFDGFEYQ